MPFRTCIGCRGVFEKGRLLRLVVEDGVLRPGRGGKGGGRGRGAYICPDRLCLQKAYKNRGAFSRAFRTRVTLPDELELWRELNR